MCKRGSEDVERVKKSIPSPKRSPFLRKVIAVSLAAFAANIVILLIAYKLFLSAGVEDFFVDKQTKAQRIASEAVDEIAESGDYKVVMDKFSSSGAILTLERFDGMTIYGSGTPISPAIEVGAAKGVVVNGESCILKVVLMTSLKQVSALDVTKRLLWVECSQCSL